MRPKLTLVAGKADKAEIRIKLPTIVGRTRNAGLMIGHKTVSRRHCELFERQGMLYVRDTGSRNGTLVDNVPIKESVLKPGHTLTVGPLTFRADYEPADAFIRGDEPVGANGAASLTTPDLESPEARAKAAPQKLETVHLSETPTSGEMEFAEVELHDAGADGDLDLPAMDDDLTVDAPNDKPTSAAKAAGDAASDDEFSDALVLEDNELEFDELTDTAPSTPKPPSLDSSASAPSVADAVQANGQAAAAGKADEVDLSDAIGSDALGGDALGDLDAEDDFLTFDLDDAPAKAAPAQESAQASAATPDDASTAEPADAFDAAPVDDLSFDDLDLAFDIKDDPPAGKKPNAMAAEIEEVDELGFTLEDLDTPIAMKDPDEPAMNGAEDNGEEEEEALEFELADPEPPKPAAKAPAAKAPVAKVAAGNSTAKKSDSSKVPLGEEKPSGGDAGASAFMKELGL